MGREERVAGGEEEDEMFVGIFCGYCCCILFLQVLPEGYTDTGICCCSFV